MIKSIEVDPLYFPGIDELEPLVAFYIDPFQMTFPIAQTDTFHANK
jgi:hypothetical protein